MSDACRAERLWLAIAVALLWLVVIAAAVMSDDRPETTGALPPGQGRRGVPKRQRLVTLRLAEWLVAQLLGRPLPQGELAPVPWPALWHDVITLTESDCCSDNIYP